MRQLIVLMLVVTITVLPSFAQQATDTAAQQSQTTSTASTATTAPQPTASLAAVNAPVVPKLTDGGAALVKAAAAPKRSKRGAILGAITGGLAGAVSGLLVGGGTREILQRAAIGAATGALIGFVIGKHQDNLYANRDQAVQEAGYVPSDGFMLQVEQVNVEPGVLKPGVETMLHVRYLVISPDPNEKITMKTTCGLRYSDTYLATDGPSPFTLTGGGIVDTTVPVTVPKNAPAGTYTIETIVEDSQGRTHDTGTNAAIIAAS